MSQCSALATKADVKTLETKGRQGISPAEESRLLQKSTALAAPLALAALNPKVQALGAKLAAQAAQISSLASKIAPLANLGLTVLSVGATLFNIKQAFDLSNQVSATRSAQRQVETIAYNAVLKANAAAATANAATQAANAARAEANRNTQIANEAVAQATLAYQQASSAIASANDSSATANRAVIAANSRQQVANTDIQKANIASSAAQATTQQANQATSKANKAIKAANANAQALANLQAENTKLKAQITKLQSSSVAATKTAEVAKKDANTSKRTVNGVTKDFITRKVKESTTTTSADIRGFNNRLVGIQSKLGKSVTKFSQSTTQTLDKRLSEERKRVESLINTGAQTGVQQVSDKLSIPKIRDISRTESQKAIKEFEKVNEKQVADIKEVIKTTAATTATLVAGRTAVQNKGITTGIRRVTAQTSAPALTRAATKGVCNSSQPGGCLSNSISNALQKNASNLVNAGGTAFAAANNALLLKMRKTLNTVQKTTDFIKGTTSATFAVINHAKYGLKAVQEFGEKAWKATHADKILNGITTAMVIHNGIMLSNNLGVTIGEAATATLNAMGIRDSKDEVIDVNSVIKAKMTSLVQQVVGSANAAILTEKIAKANRIYQAGVNVLDATQSLFDGARAITELGLENTGKIGNALRDSGAVLEDSYDEMIDKVNSQSKAMRKLESFRNTLDNVGETVETINQISSEIVEFKDNAAELKSASDVWQTETENLRKDKREGKEELKKDAEVKAEINRDDFDVAPSTGGTN